VRPRWSTWLWLALFGILVLIGTRGSGLIGRTEDDRLGAVVGGRVVRVIDGDTIRVRLVLGRERRDRYGRLLAYVQVQGGPLVEDELLRGGYARTLTIPPNDDRAAHFAALERTARGQRRGRWGACPAGRS